MATTARSYRLGFTLIELMVTIAVLAILVTLAMPSFSDFFDRYRLRGAVDDVISVISNARAESVKTGLDVRVDFAGTTTDWCVAANPAVVPTAGEPIVEPPDCNCSTGTCSAMPGGQVLAVPVNEHGKVSASGPTVMVAFVFDSKLGMITPLGTASATFRSPTSKYAMQVNVNAMGQASVCRPSTPPEPVIAGVPTCP